MARARPARSDPDRARVREHLDALSAAPGFAAAERALDAMAAEIGMPVMAWAPDVSRPHFDAHMDAFMRRHGWPEDVLSLWWNRRVMLKMPIYIRCRVEHLPFVSPVDFGAGQRASPELRHIAHVMADQGLRSLITAPVNLPRGQIAMVTWVGPRAMEDAARIVKCLRAELLAAGHLFMEAFEREFGGTIVAAEEKVPLTPQEWECLRLLAQGYREAEIARLKGVAATTIRFHLDNVVRKLGASNRTHAVALAAQLGVLGAIGG
jgi:DNA-binding CsgD family transcriptional regulator